MHLDGSPGVDFGHGLVAGDPGVGDDLEIAEAGAVVEFEEGECLGIPAGADPAGHVQVIGGLGATQNVLDE